MPKAASPIRLDKTLMSAAKVAGTTLRRSAAEQVEYWADIGRKVENTVDPNTLLAVQSGLAVIRVEETPPVMADPDAVFAALDQQRASGTLSQAIATDRVRYQASATESGKLEACYPDGRIVQGQFINGLFQADTPSG